MYCPKFWYIQLEIEFDRTLCVQHFILRIYSGQLITNCDRHKVQIFILYYIIDW